MEIENTTLNNLFYSKLNVANELVYANNRYRLSMLARQDFA
jgi:hypothetical protein